MNEDISNNRMLGKTWVIPEFSRKIQNPCNKSIFIIIKIIILFWNTCKYSNFLLDQVFRLRKKIEIMSVVTICRLHVHIKHVADISIIVLTISSVQSLKNCSERTRRNSQETGCWSCGCSTRRTKSTWKQRTREYQRVEEESWWFRHTCRSHERQDKNKQQQAEKANIDYDATFMVHKESPKRIWGFRTNSTGSKETSRRKRYFGTARLKEG